MKLRGLLVLCALLACIAALELLSSEPRAVELLTLPVPRARPAWPTSPPELLPLARGPDVLARPESASERGEAREETAGGEPSRVEQLVLVLQRIDESTPDVFHAQAAAELAAFVQGPARDDLEARALQRDEIVAILDGWSLSSRVRGALFAILGAWGEDEALLARCSLRGEEWRSALLGLAWIPEGGDPAPDGRTGLLLDPGEFLSRVPRGGGPWLPFRLQRMAQESLQATLERLVLEPAEELDRLSTRNVEVLALGTGVDVRPATRRLFRTLLLDRSPPSMQVWPSLVYVLAHAKSPEARGLLHEFLADPQLGDHGKHLARWWLGDAPPMQGEIGILAAPLFDPRAELIDRIAAIAALGKRVGAAPPDDRIQIEELLASHILDESEWASRLASVTTLAEFPGGLTKLTTLARVLREDDRASCRLWAAHGLALMGPPHQAEARSLLQAALGSEPDEGVAAKIREALGESG